MSICPHPCPSGSTGPPGRRLGAGLGLSPSIPVSYKRLELGFPGGVLHSCSESAAGVQVWGARSPVRAADQVRAVWVSPDQGSDHCRASTTTGRSYPPTDSATR